MHNLNFLQVLRYQEEFLHGIVVTLEMTGAAGEWLNVKQDNLPHI